MSWRDRAQVSSNPACRKASRRLSRFSMWLSVKSPVVLFNSLFALFGAVMVAVSGVLPIGKSVAPVSDMDLQQGDGTDPDSVEIGQVTRIGPRNLLT